MEKKVERKKEKAYKKRNARNFIEPLNKRSVNIEKESQFFTRKIAPQRNTRNPEKE